MAKVHLLSVCPTGHESAARVTEQNHKLMLRLAQNAERHQLCEDPRTADVILMYVSYGFFWSDLDPTRRCVRQHPLRQRFMEKTCVYDPHAKAISLIPGVFANLDRKSFRPSRERSGPHIDYLRHEDLEPSADRSSPDYLFSFVGACNTHASRAALPDIDHPRGRIVDTSSLRPWRDGNISKAAYRRQFVESIHGSKFVLCPRGYGTSSIRLFEAMRAGRAPVVISDDYIPPAGPDWQKCSLWVAEDEVAELPRLLEERESDAARLGQEARKAWEQHFSNEVVFDYIVDQCIELIDARQFSERWARFAMAGEVMRPAVVKRWAKDLAREFTGR